MKKQTVIIGIVVIIVISSLIIGYFQFFKPQTAEKTEMDRFLGTWQLGDTDTICRFYQEDNIYVWYNGGGIGGENIKTYCVYEAENGKLTASFTLYGDTISFIMDYEFSDNEEELTMVSEDDIVYSLTKIE
ncbi:MAG: hypothetical protein KAR64_08905 [Thermoplasmatales archaeon]|nr:hypothetical protein [Thermoplasmatales archaeon]